MESQNSQAIARPKDKTGGGGIATDDLPRVVEKLELAERR